MEKEKKICVFQARDYPKITKIVCTLGRVKCKPKTCPIYQIWKIMEKGKVMEETKKPFPRDEDWEEGITN